MDAQTRTSASNQPTSFQAKKTGERKLISSKDLREGSNYIRLGSTKVEIVKTRGRITSIKSINNTGKIGPNILQSEPEATAFTCIGNMCVCFGDNDCNDMFTSNVCSPATEDAVCVDDNCICVKD